MSQFNELGLASALLTALKTLGYETPTPIQAQSIPVLMQGHDLLAQAQTGTGKTAAFALPALSQLDLSMDEPQVLIIAPTRELAIQVAEACQSYAKDMPGFHVAPIYGGQEYRIQLRALKRGAHVVVGTPGRVMDHMRRGTLSVDALQMVVLDEADEMLNMGFVKDIEWILEQIPHQHQTALFSATMPAPIQKIAKRYLKHAERIHIEPQHNTVDTIEQCFIRVARNQKLDVLTRFLEVEDIQAAIIFSRTKTYSTELAERLQARGYAAAPLNGDMNQAARKKVVERLKNGSLDIVVATDIAARGIDVERVSHVINIDIPYDAECYIHRIGRTGRAGRKGKALLFVTPREQRLLKDIERAINKSITQIEAPTLQEMKAIRSKQLTEKVTGIINKSKRLDTYREMVQEIMQEDEGYAAEDIAAALAYLMDQANELPTHDIVAVDAEPEKRRHKPARSRGKPSSRSRNTKDREFKKERSFKGAKKKAPSSAKRKVGKRQKPEKIRSRRK